MSRATRFLGALLLAFPLLCPSVLAVEPGDGERPLPGDREAESVRFPPLPVDPRVYSYGNPWLSDVALKISNGTATLPERRSYYYLLERLTPFACDVPPDWRSQAARAERALRPLESGRAESPSWTLLGPSTYTEGSTLNSGRATAIWVDPGNKNNILLGTADGGVWRTTDQGNTWSSIFDSASTQAVGAVTVDPNNHNVIYVGTGEGNFGGDNFGGVGIFKSTDGGATWTGTNLPWSYTQPFQSIRRIAVDPRNSQQVYAAGDGGLFISSNGGSTWSLTVCGNSPSDPNLATDVILDSSTPAQGYPSIVYAAFGYPNGSTSNGIYGSADGGSTWVWISAAGFLNYTLVGRITLMAVPSDPRQMYALVQNLNTNAGEIYYTSDATQGASAFWNKRPTGPNFCGSQCWYAITGAVDPSNPSHLIVGGLDDYASTNGGSTLNQVSCWSCNNTPATYSHADHHHMVMPDSTTVYDANDGGFFVGTVSGTSVTWSARNANLPTLQFYGLAMHPTDSTKMHGGLQDNGDAYFDGSSWYQVAGGDGGKAAWDQQNASYAYEEYVYAYIARNAAMGTSPSNFQCIRNFGGCSDCNNYGCVPDNRVGFIAPFTLDPDNQNTMYTGTYRVYANTNVRGGTTWNAISGDLTSDPSSYITIIHPAPNNGLSGTIYAGTLDGNVQVTTNGGANWQNVSAGLDGSAVTWITTDPQNAAHVLVTLSGFGTHKVMRSLNGGGSWTDITGTLPSIPFNCIVLDPSNPTSAYAGADMGVYQNTSVWTSAAWTSVTYNLPAVSVQELRFNPVTGRLRAATHGRGIYELAVSPPSLSASASASPTSGAAPLPVSFTGSASGGTPPYTYAWAFGDGGSGSGASPSHTYSAAGSFGVTLTVTDSASQTATDSHLVIQVAPSPSLSATTSASPSAGPPPLTVSLTASASGGTPPYGYAWTFGDGGSGSGAFTSHIYTSLGSYTATVTVTDAASHTATAQAAVSVQNCVVSCSASVPSTATSGSAVTFTATASLSGCSGSPAFDWDFGDGSAHSSHQIDTHTYATAGTYEWHLTVTSGGQSCTQTAQIVVSGACTLSCDASVQAIAPVGQPVAFSGSATATNCAGNPAYDWDFGDGTTHATSLSASHSYNSAATYTWTFKATAPGQTCTKSGQIVVVIPPVVTSMNKMVPFAIKVLGTGFQPGVHVFINGTQWSPVTWKSGNKIIIGGGKALKALVPRGVPTGFLFVNPDGGSVSRTWNW